jgi:hypothetical protein
MQNNNTDTVPMTPNQTSDKTFVLTQDIDEQNDSVSDTPSKNGFIGINSLYKKLSHSDNDEIKRIEYTLEKLSETVYNYMLRVKNMWDAEIQPFIESSDCFILENLSQSDYKRFRDFMCEQKPYRLMMVSQKRLIARREYILSMG